MLVTTGGVVPQPSCTHKSTVAILGRPSVPVSELSLPLSVETSVCQRPLPLHGVSFLQSDPKPVFIIIESSNQPVQVHHVIYCGQVSVLCSAVTLGVSPVHRVVNEVKLMKT
ncbi:hypothetical protein J4Q44_G00053960 [Coregonus suidteri]|uniref:Uncharacterized protein n=1 Tax=Coregonus suidteri TaxID=861788 RepID=A0AAN8MA07_9TELE